MATFVFFFFAIYSMMLFDMGDLFQWVALCLWGTLFSPLLHDLLGVLGLADGSGFPGVQCIMSLIKLFIVILTCWCSEVIIVST